MKKNKNQGSDNENLDILNADFVGEKQFCDTKMGFFLTRIVLLIVVIVAPFLMPKKSYAMPQNPGSSAPSFTQASVNHDEGTSRALENESAIPEQALLTPEQVLAQDLENAHIIQLQTAVYETGLDEILKLENMILIASEIRDDLSSLTERNSAQEHVLSEAREMIKSSMFLQIDVFRTTNAAALQAGIKPHPIFDTIIDKIEILAALGL